MATHTYTYIKLSTLLKLAHDARLTDPHGLDVWVKDKKSLYLGSIAQPLFVIDFEEENLNTLQNQKVATQTLKQQTVSPAIPILHSTKQQDGKSLSKTRPRFVYKAQLLGKIYEYYSQRELVRGVLRLLQEKDKTFLDKLSTMTRKEGKIPRVSPKKENLFLNKKVVEKNCDQLMKGWYINVNFSWNEMVKLLEKSCTCLNIKFRKDLTIEKIQSGK